MKKLLFTVGIIMTINLNNLASAEEVCWFSLMTEGQTLVKDVFNSGQVNLYMKPGTDLDVACKDAETNSERTFQLLAGDEFRLQIPPKLYLVVQSRINDDRLGQLIANARGESIGDSGLELHLEAKLVGNSDDNFKVLEVTTYGEDNS